jgi:pimeloyl-ACP methyl ester carboxylesterase
MVNLPVPVIFLSGAGGEAPSFETFRFGRGNDAKFETIAYPGWTQYAAEEFTPEALIADLETKIISKVPQGPIRIVGYSLGGHFGYAVALRLQAAGREIAGFCAIDSFMIESLGPSAGWKARAVSQGLGLLRKCQLREFNRFIRSKFWRAMLRLFPPRLPILLNGVWSHERLSAIVAFDRVLETELTLRLLLRKVTPWIKSLDYDPVALDAPAALLRSSQYSQYDAIWRLRCPAIEVIEISGQHSELFSSENIGSLRDSLAAATSNWR